MTLWDDLGFRENPYSTDPIPANEDGMRLLVGRKNELAQLRRYLTSSTNHPTIEGSNGVGKTSLVGIAAYALYLDHQNAPNETPMFIPATNPFQISATESPEIFTEKFVLAMARDLIFYREFIPKNHPAVEKIDGLKRFLNDPLIQSSGGSVNILGVGAGLSVSHSANTSQGFAKGGVEANLREILGLMFPRKGHGGFVCILDNLELLDTSAKARSTLEALRDGALSFPGVKWVLCGARGIVRSVASTPRLQGKLSNPIELLPLTAENVKSAIQQRLDIFRTRENAYVPVDTEGFSRLYDIGNKNLRISLKFCEDFVFWCMDTDNRPESSVDKLALLDVWFAQEAQHALLDTHDVGERAWSVFDGIAKSPEGISPGDYEQFEFNSAQALQPHLRSLEQATLIESTTAETDKRRKTITLTPRGWIVRYHRNEYRV